MAGGRSSGKVTFGCKWLISSRLLPRLVSVLFDKVTKVTQAFGDLTPNNTDFFRSASEVKCYMAKRRLTTDKSVSNSEIPPAFFGGVQLLGLKIPHF
jgi:hypothetical protein